LIQEAVGLVKRFALQRYIGPWVYGSQALIVNDTPLSRGFVATMPRLIQVLSLPG